MVNSNNVNHLYDTPDQRLNTMLGRSDVDFWRKLRKLKSEIDLGGLEFQDWLVEEYGVKLTLTSNTAGQTGYDPQAEIVDEQKYLIFLLKY